MISKIDFFQFIKNPKQTFEGSFRTDLILFGCLFLFKILSLVLKAVLNNQPFIEDNDAASLQMGVFFSYVFMFPLLEELFFRGFLNFNRKYIIALCFIAYTVLPYLYWKNLPFKGYIFLGIAVFCVLMFIKSNFYQGVLNFIQDQLSICVIISSLAFAFMHLSNYKDFDWTNLIAIGHKFISGLFYAYIAYKYCIARSWFFHACNNALPFLLIIIYQILS